MKPARDLEYLKARYSRHIEKREWKKANEIHLELQAEMMKQLRKEIRQDKRRKVA